MDMPSWMEIVLGQWEDGGRGMGALMCGRLRSQAGELREGAEREGNIMKYG